MSVEMPFRLRVSSNIAGLDCWNLKAFVGHAEADNLRGDEVARALPDVDRYAGSITCSGCQLMEDGIAKCTAQLSNSIYGEGGQMPSREDRPGDVTAIAGFLPEAPEPFEPPLSVQRAA